MTLISFYAERKKPDSKRCLPRDSIYTAFWKRQNFRDRKQIRGWEEEEAPVTRAQGGNAEGNTQQLDYGGVYTTVEHLSNLTQSKGTSLQYANCTSVNPAPNKQKPGTWKMIN